MSVALVGDYDASTFDDGDYDTYPQLPAGVLLYQPTMHWRVTVAGTVQGQDVVPGDMLFATQGGGRLYGDGNYGDQIFGGISDGNWTVDQVLFLRWDSTRPPPDLDPYPNAGCAYTRADQADGDWAPGWRIVVDAYFANPTGSRTYGAGDFGDDVFGDVDDAGGDQWVDITQPGYRIETGDGTAAGGQRVPVAEVVIQLIDDDGIWFDIAEPETWYQPQPGTPLRVGFIDPDYVYWPVFVGEIERIEDVHDSEHPRVVAVRGFGRIMDLTVDVPNWQRPDERASTRFMQLVGAAGWSWDDGLVDFPYDDAGLLPDLAPRDITVRDEIDRTVQAVGWFFDADRRGRMRLRRWPHEPFGDPLLVVDCVEPGAFTLGEDALIEDPMFSGLYLLGGDGAIEEDPPGSDVYEVEGAEIIADPDTLGLYEVEGGFVPGTPDGALTAHQIVFVNDQSQLLNYVMTTNTASPDVEQVVEVNDLSVSRFGRRGRALDYPKTSLPWAFADVTAAWARRVVNRFGFITRHVESMNVDTAIDPGWLPVLAGLDTGRAVTVQRNGIRPLSLDGAVVGWRHVIEPGRWTSTLFTTTTTTSM